MKAVILNSGIGKRMGALTADKPKCLIEVSENETILSRQLKLLWQQGLREFVITTGPFAGRIEKYVQENFPGINVAYVQNPRYESTNYIYSLLLAEDFLRDELLLLHGDLVFEAGVLQRLLADPNQNAVLVDAQEALPEKDFKGRINDGTVQEISVNITGDDCCFLIPMYKLSVDLAAAWMQAMRDFQQKGELNVYAENALNTILGKEQLSPVYFDGLFCAEVDTPEDLAQVRRKIERLD